MSPLNLIATILLTAAVTFAASTTAPATGPATTQVAAPVADNLTATEWAVFVVDASAGQMNPQGWVTNTLPGFIGDHRFALSSQPPVVVNNNVNNNLVFNGRFWMRVNAVASPDSTAKPELAESDEPSPVAVIRLTGSVDSKVDVSISNTTGAFLGSWPKAEERDKQLLWRDLTVSNQPPQMPQLVGDTHWFNQLRAVDSAYLSLKTGGSDRFLLYDIESPYTSPLKIKAGKDFKFEVTNQTSAPLHDLTFYLGDKDNWRTATIGDVPASLHPATTAPAVKTLDAAQRLGVKISDVSADPTRALNFGYRRGRGVFVDEVTPGSPAEGKLNQNDIILTVNNKAVTAADFASQITGDSIKLRVYRANRNMQIAIALSPAATQPTPSAGVTTQPALEEDVIDKQLKDQATKMSDLLVKAGVTTAPATQAATTATAGTVDDIMRRMKQRRAAALGIADASTQPSATTSPAAKSEELTKSCQLSPAASTQPTDLAEAWKPIITQAGVSTGDAALITRIISHYAFDPHRLTAVYRMDDAEINRLLPIEIVPQPAKLNRFALVIVINADPPAGTIVDDLIKQLGDDDWSKRDAAFRALAAMGPAAQAKLTTAKNSSDLEVSWRAERLLGQLPQK